MTIINMSGGRAGRTPVYQARTVTPTAFPTNVQPQEGYDALSQVTVNAPANLLAQNIRKGVNIAGVLGTYEAVAPTISLQQKTVTPSASPQIVTPDEGYDGLSQVQVVGSSNLGPANIRAGVNIFGVVGTYTGPAPSMSGGTFNYEYDPDTPTFPMIRSTRTVGVDTEGFAYFDSTGVCLMGNHIDYAYTDGRWRSWGAYPMASQWFSLHIDDVDMIRTPDFTGTLSTNRNTTSMDGFLSDVASRIGEDYFNGSMSCALWWIGVGDDGWQSAISAGTQSGATVSFTYSNGRCTYTIPSNIIYNIGVYVPKRSNVTRAYPALFFTSMNLSY